MNKILIYSINKHTSSTLKLILPVIIILLLTGGLHSQSFHYKFNHLTIDEGLSHTDANDIAQDQKGFIWIATFFGLDRFDGYRVKKYYNSNDPINNAFKNRINCIYPDGDGNIWLGTEAGLQRFDAKTETYLDYKDPYDIAPVLTKIYKPEGNILFALLGDQVKIYTIKGQTISEKKLNTPKDFKCSNMTIDNKGTVYLTSNLGLWTLNTNGDFTYISINPLPDSNLSGVYFDDANNLIVTAQNRVFLTKRITQQSSTIETSFIYTKQFIVPDKKSILGLQKKGNKEFWINTGSNLFRLNQDLKLIQTINKRNSSNELNSNILTRIFIDRSECMWVCTFGGGVNYFNLNEKLFYTLQNNPRNTNSLSGNHIRSVLVNDDDVWIGTTANGLNLYNLRTQNYTYYNTTDSALGLKSNEVTALILDNKQNLWIGTSAGIDIMRPDRKTLWHPTGHEDFPKYVIETFAKDYFGNIWFGNHSDEFGVIWKNKENNYEVKYYGDAGYFIFADKNKPQLFISSTNGLKRILVDKEGNITKEFNYRASTQPNSLSSNYTYPICKQNDSTYWIGTIGGGLNRLILHDNNLHEIKTYNEGYGIFKDVESMEIDNTGNIWMGGNGLQQFDPKTAKLIRYDKKDGLQGNSFKVNSSFKDADGRLYFGGINGLNYFLPAKIKDNKIPAKPVLTDILVNNTEPAYKKEENTKTVLQKSISFCKKISLDYLQNNFVISFSSMHFANPIKCKYRYKLEGFDETWKYTDGRNPIAAYNNLDYKDYKFILQASNSDGVWSKDSAKTIFEITPPWWKSTIAKSCYILLILAFLIGIYIYQARWYRLKREMEVRAVDEQKREEVHKQKEELYQQQLLFFTNISHEFRTPLTLIVGPLERLIQQNKDTSLNHSYQLMLRNAKRLINLISELMNFKKVADSVIKLKVQPVNIHRFCSNLASDFNNLSISKEIKFTMNDYTQTKTPLIAWFDIQIMEKIIFNLLNNSFKYTDIGGEVSLDIATDPERLEPSFKKGFKIENDIYKAEHYIYLRIADSGIGISEESINQIFDRYYRIKNNHLGSGVGLALVKSLTLLHKGKIYVYSEKNKGTEIIIAIPSDEHNYTTDEKKKEESGTETQLEKIDYSVQIASSNFKELRPQELRKGKKNILLVDDNKELLTFLTEILASNYNIFESKNGIEAIEKATEIVPDLIISDLMMPKMDGINLCKAIKNKFETSHIPFIILSAKDAIDSKIHGMESGADYYFAKPLSTDLLLLTISNIFDQREKIKEHYITNYLSQATELVESKKDKAFINEVINVIETNIEDADLSVDYLCDQLFISRTKLYQKIKSISDQSVGEFIRTIRLKKAVQIMTHENVTMTEVAERTGLQSGSNFSRIFKREYGKSPKQFMQDLRNNQFI